MKASVFKRVPRLWRRKRCPECGTQVRQLYCDACGYDLIKRTRDRAEIHRLV